LPFFIVVVLGQYWMLCCILEEGHVEKLPLKLA